MAKADVMDGLVTTLVEKFCGGELDSDLLRRVYPDAGAEPKDEELAEVHAVQARRDAKRVYDYLAALEHEGKIRSLQGFADSAGEVHDGLDRAARDRDWKAASALYTAFGQGLGRGPTAGVVAWGLRFAAHAQNMAQGSTNEAHVRTAQEMIREVGRAIVLEVVELRRRAPGRGPDAWHPDVLKAAEDHLRRGEST